MPKTKTQIDFNWNCDEHPLAPRIRSYRPDPTPGQVSRIQLVAEDLRDGLHGIHQYPTVEQMKSYINQLVLFGFNFITVGIYTGFNNKIDHAVKETLAYLKSDYPQITPIVITLTTEDSIAWIDECRKVHPRVQILVFMGTSPMRQIVEDWNRNKILKQLSWAVRTVVHDYKLKAIATPEQATQTPPDFLEEIIRESVAGGAQLMCIPDTIGISRPIGTIRIVEFFKKTLKKFGASRVPIDWHGHDDLGNGSSNAMAAIAAGAGRIHTVARGIGERAGNTRLETVVLNCAEILREANLPIPWHLKSLTGILSTYDEMTQNPTPTHGPLSNRAFKTSLGIHTAAMLKAEKLANESYKKKHIEQADRYVRMSQRIYCAVEAAAVGREHEISVGPWSGKSTVELASLKLKLNMTTISEDVIQMVIATAKKLGRELTPDELIKLLKPNHEAD